MAMQKSKSPRRREIRRNFGKPQPRLTTVLKGRHTGWSVLFVVVLGLLGGALAMLGRERPLYEVGQVVRKPVVARVDFTATDAEETRKAKQRNAERAPAVYSPNVNHLRNIHDKLITFGELGANEAIEEFDMIAQPQREALELTEQSFRDLRAYLNREDAKPWPELSRQIVYEGLASIPVLEHHRVQYERDNPAVSIVIEHPEHGEQLRQDETLISAEQDQEELRKRLEAYLQSKLPASLQRSVIAIMMPKGTQASSERGASAVEPTYFINDVRSADRRDKARAATAVVEVKRFPGDVLVQAGEELSSLDVQLLEKEQQAYQEEMGMVYRAVQIGCTVGIVLLLSLGLWTYVGAYLPRIAHNGWRGGSLTGLVLVTQGVAVAAVYINSSYTPAAASTAVIFLAMILAIVYDQRFALAISTIHTILVVITLNLTPGFAIVLLGGVAVAVGMLDQVSYREKLLATGAAAGATMAAISIIINLAFDPPLMLMQSTSQLASEGVTANAETSWFSGYLFWDAFLPLASCIVTGAFVGEALPPIERLFKVTTALQLRELNDASHPLLSRLAQDASGTYQHSLRIADMAESAAQAIGANGLLCRVGAMYHDIGKINKPMYFVENQGGGPNKHNKLSPAMSVLIIVGHVKDGVELAREFAIPPTVRAFIETHHGTTLVEYFYHAARRQSDQQQMPAPNEFEFRYPGPKPQTKEHAILMICDSVEGAARTLPEPTPARLEQLVHQIANKRLMDGQFEDCNLTLAELHRIEESITKTLQAIYHARVKYPSQQGEGGQRNREERAENAPREEADGHGRDKPVTQGEQQDRPSVAS